MEKLLRLSRFTEWFTKILSREQHNNQTAYTQAHYNKTRALGILQDLCDHEDSEYIEASLRFMESIWRRKIKESGMEDAA